MQKTKAGRDLPAFIVSKNGTLFYAWIRNFDSLHPLSFILPGFGAG